MGALPTPHSFRTPPSGVRTEEQQCPSTPRFPPARALTRALEARAIALTGEVAPGIPIGTLSGGPRHGRAIVTKAGGFGSPTALLEAAEAVRHPKGRNA